MKLHLLGICGTFMGGLALLARELGHDVSGTDENIYPPMSTMLDATGIELKQGYSVSNLQPAPDLVVIGNSLSRGNPCVEYVLDKGLKFKSGPQWLAENILMDRFVIAVSGTHGKTTTTSILTWMLESAGMQPGFLIGGITENFGVSARLGKSDFFVIEADEYDTAFFDKRSKFIHYHPNTLIINNIEYDHADIFNDMRAIRREFHHLIRTIPGSGEIIVRKDDMEIEQVLTMGCWTPVVTFGSTAGDWVASPLTPDYSSFQVRHCERLAGTVNWDLIGMHNAENALAALAAAARAGVEPAGACEAMNSFRSVKRRLQRLVTINGMTIYDDFAHHPTAIKSTLVALRKHIGQERIIAILEPRSNTMKSGVHKDTLGNSLEQADLIYFLQPQGMNWDIKRNLSQLGPKCVVLSSVTEIIKAVSEIIQPGDHIVIMSNGGFENIQQRLIELISL